MLLKLKRKSYKNEENILVRWASNKESYTKTNGKISNWIKLLWERSLKNYNLVGIVLQFLIYYFDFVKLFLFKKLGGKPPFTLFCEELINKC